MQIVRQFAWNIKACFLETEKKYFKILYAEVFSKHAKV